MRGPVFKLSSVQGPELRKLFKARLVYFVFPDAVIYIHLSHAIENTSTAHCIFCGIQWAVFHEKIPVFLEAYKFFPPKDRLKSLRQVKIFIQKKLLSALTKTLKKNTPVLNVILNS